MEILAINKKHEYCQTKQENYQASQAKQDKNNHNILQLISSKFDQ